MGFLDAARLPPGSPVAVVSMVGSLCPVTLAHIQAYHEARAMLLGEGTAGVAGSSPGDKAEEEEEASGRRDLEGDEPRRRERFAAVVGLVVLNSAR